jgi:hypothetical protein
MHSHSLRLSGALLGLACALHTPLSAATATDTPKVVVLNDLAARRLAIAEARDATLDGKFDQAVIRLQRLVVIRPGRPPADLQLAELVTEVAVIAQNESDLKGAKKLASMAAQLADRRTPAWPKADRVHAARLSAQVSQYLLGDNNRALKAYNEASQLDPQDKVVQRELARVKQELALPQQKMKEQQHLPRTVVRAKLQK